ncbi:Sfi1-domain-containing protein [Sporormia fimetaria CBS 119925]|uniref:Sfi1-domain-containing protein n=1 Tax=Sporormia fimetaria CBS 119925 TaxID=1340428 RepID=A0A6A6V2S6_9PLEO|nr:Sfi1-domain-containing protein [Sporormia fimetaria CBS 119925]
MTTRSDEASPLTNDEIETLYDIVRDAQSLPDPPYRALFKAYDRVLAERGLDDAKGRYFTFLVRMQDEAALRHEVLVDTYQRVLAQQGIQVEIDPEGEGVEVTTNLDNLLEAGDTSQHARSRRGSFDSYLERTTHDPPGWKHRELPHRTRKHSRAASDTGEPRGIGHPRVNADTGARPQPLPHRGRPNGHNNHRIPSTGPPSRPRRSASVSSRGSLRIYRNGYATNQSVDDHDGSYSEPTDSFDRSHIQIPGVNAPLPEGGDHQGFGPPVTDFRPSDTQIERDADTFVHHRGLAVERKYLEKWQERLAGQVEKRRRMELAAVTFYNNILMRASIESFRIALQARRQTHETDRFFQRLETRAEKARNLFLLTKAFTHWAKSAEDEVQRTSTARRHILRTKYFNAWRDITAVNELKIQHFILAKFLSIWRSRSATIAEHNGMAVSLYEHNIVYRIYWQWFWKFGERRAPILHRNRLATDMIRKWAEIVAILKEREVWAAEQWDSRVARSGFLKVKERTVMVRSQHAQANDFRTRALLLNAFSSLRRRACFAPLERQIENKLDSRHTLDTFQLWQRHAQLSRRAREVDRMRILRNCFTAWNDRLRVLALQERINDRLQLQALYKWTLASRVSLFQRVHNHRVKESVFAIWVSKTQTHESRRQIAGRRFASFKRAQMLRSSLRKCETATVKRREQEYLALSIYEPKLMHRTFGKVLDKHAHLQQLDSWAERANYYVTTKHAIKRWQAATEFARRTRRREAYAYMRRTVKIHLARRMFGRWRERFEQVSQMRVQSDDIARGLVLRTAGALLEHWHDEAIRVRDLEAQAVEHEASKQMASTFATWLNKLQALQSMDEQAQILRQETAHVAASGCLKKLSWKVWTVTRQGENAIALRDRNFEKHVRAMMRFWRDQTTERLAAKGEQQSEGGQDNDDSSDSDRTDNEQPSQPQTQDSHGEHTQVSAALRSSGDETQRLESWTPFNDQALSLRDLDLSFSVSPSKPPNRPTAASSARRPVPKRPFTIPSNQLRTEPRPRTHPRLSSIMRNRTSRLAPVFPPIEEASPDPDRAVADIVDDVEMEMEGLDAGSTFWTSTPMPPRRVRMRSLDRTERRRKDVEKDERDEARKPGYLQTPSKRSVVRERITGTPRVG